ncbi:MAG TPA: dual specificity protein phosphatase family protein [Thermoanaerobaculia bacterium]|nr:dual specificity protein phosphatase family protein [Thermoanaerobaculia bacterium]
MSDTGPSSAAARHATIYSKPGLPAFEHWQVAPRLRAGRNPLSELDLRQLAALGVTHVLDLREEAEWAAPGNWGEDAVIAIPRLGLGRLHLPVRDGGAPAVETLAAAVEWIEEVLATPGTAVYVHCRAGLERTASVLVAWRARRDGSTLEEALGALGEAGYPGAPLRNQKGAVRAFLAGAAG